MIYAGVRNEFVKLLYLKKYKALLVLLSLFCIGAGLAGHLAKGFIGLSLSNTPLAVLPVITGFLLPLIISLAAADLFTAEQENGSIKAIITRPLSRISIYTSKILTIVLYVMLALLLCLIISSAWSVLVNGTSLMSVIEAVISYTVSIIPMLPYVLFAVMISQLCRNSSSTVMLSVFGYIAITGVGILMSGISPIVFTSYTGWYKLFIGAAMPITHILSVTSLLAAYTLIFYAAGAWAFEKKEY